MTKDISIKEDGVEKSFSGVKKLRTKLLGGGSCDWVPTDSLVGKTITDVGIYRAVDENANGYSVVNVSILNADTKHY